MAALLRGGEQLLARSLINIVSKHGYATQAKLRLSSSPNPAERTKPAPTVLSAAIAPCTTPTPTAVKVASACRNSKRIQIVEGAHVDTPLVFSLRLQSSKDFRQMLTASGLLCLVPARQDPSTKTWRLSGEGTRCFSDLRENTFYMAMSAVRSPSISPSPASHSLRETVKQLRNELANRARGEEGELTEVLLRIFSAEAGFPDMENKQELRIIQNEEVDAVLFSARAIVIGFHCNKLTLREAAAAFTRVSQWFNQARKGSPHHSFLLGKDVYVVLSGNLLPNKETQRVISFCKRHNLIILLKNGVNFSMHNSLLPKQQMLPANVHLINSNK